MKKYININTVLIGLVLVLAIAFFAWQNLGKTGGKVAAVHIDNHDEVIRIELDKDGEYPITGGKLPVTLVVKDGAIAFVDSQCPDHICEGTGFISRESRTAICMPAGVAIIIE